MQPMLCSSIDSPPEHGDEYRMEPKLDGWRLLMWKNPAGKVHVVAGRNAADYTGQLPYLETEIASCLPNDTCLDGELIGSQWGDVQSIMSANGPHVPTKKSGGLQFVAFDVIRLNGRDIRSLAWRYRRELLEAIKFDGYVRITDVYPCTARTYQVAVATGFEGVVCKRLDSEYVNGRSTAWPKIKAVWTVEASVTGFNTGSSSSVMGSVTATLLRDDGKPELNPAGKPVTIRVGGGFTDVQREEIASTWPAWRGTIIEVQHNGRMDSGKLRHPTFTRVRDDKAASVATPSSAASQARRGRPAPRVAPPGSWVRNYGAMGDAKLVKSIKELERQSGDAYDRVVQRQGDVAFNLTRAHEAARARGWGGTP